MIGAVPMMAGAPATGQPSSPQSSGNRGVAPTVRYRTQHVGDAEVFFREAGAPSAPVILLLHGFPTASHMFRDLIPALADRYRVIAPDLPGFGQTKAPPRGQFNYCFDRLSPEAHPWHGRRSRKQSRPCENLWSWSHPAFFWPEGQKPVTCSGLPLHRHRSGFMGNLSGAALAHMAAWLRLVPLGSAPVRRRG
ncbi:alpha/beta fold hydrolase [Sphingomonas gellani]